MRWLGRHRFVNALLDHAPGAVLVSAAVVPLTQGGGVHRRRGAKPSIMMAWGRVRIWRWAP